MRAALAIVADACCVLAFVVIGRASHSDGETVAGIASTAWPFLAGTRAWLGTVLIGQAVRVLAGQGTALAFIVVSLLFLGLFLLGWRLAARWALRASR